MSETTHCTGPISLPFWCTHIGTAISIRRSYYHYHYHYCIVPLAGAALPSMSVWRVSRGDHTTNVKAQKLFGDAHLILSVYQCRNIQRSLLFWPLILILHIFNRPTAILGYLCVCFVTFLPTIFENLHLKYRDCSLCCSTI